VVVVRVWLITHPGSLTPCRSSLLLPSCSCVFFLASFSLTLTKWCLYFRFITDRCRQCTINTWANERIPWSHAFRSLARLRDFLRCVVRSNRCRMNVVHFISFANEHHRQHLINMWEKLKYPINLAASNHANTERLSINLVASNHANANRWPADVGPAISGNWVVGYGVAGTWGVGYGVASVPVALPATRSPFILRILVNMPVCYIFSQINLHVLYILMYYIF
jgi:hypothetical protein